MTAPMMAPRTTTTTATATMILIHVIVIDNVMLMTIVTMMTIMAIFDGSMHGSINMSPLVFTENGRARPLLLQSC